MAGPEEGIYCETHSGGALGGRPPLVLIHGAGGTHLSWPPALRRLEKQTVHGLDLPGHGRSQGTGEASIEAYLAAVLRWMGHLVIERAVWMGHSMGSAVALSAGLHAPSRVAGLVLVGAGGRLRVDPSILELASRPETFGQAVEAIQSLSYGREASASLVTLAGRRLAETRPEVLDGDLRACDAFDVLDRLGEIPAPALVVCGQEDRLTPQKYSRRLVEAMPDARLELIAGAGHMVMLEKPQAVAQAVQRFLDERIARVDSP